MAVAFLDQRRSTRSKYEETESTNEFSRQRSDEGLIAHFNYADPSGNEDRPHSNIYRKNRKGALLPVGFPRWMIKFIQHADWIVIYRIHFNVNSIAFVRRPDSSCSREIPPSGQQSLYDVQIVNITRIKHKSRVDGAIRPFQEVEDRCVRFRHIR